MVKGLGGHNLLSRSVEDTGRRIWELSRGWKSASCYFILIILCHSHQESAQTT